MNCCGQKRLHWLQETTHREPGSVSQEPVLEKPVPLHYHGTDNYLVKGPQTGLLYLFAPREPGLMVDGQDAPLLLAGSQKFSLAKQ